MLGAGDGGPPDEKPEVNWIAPPVTDSEPEVESPNSAFFLKGTGTENQESSQSIEPSLD